MDNKKISAILSMLLVTIFWGVSFISTKVSLQAFGPMTIAFLRSLIAIAALFVIIKITKTNIKIKIRDIYLFAIAGLTGITLYFLFENHSINMIHASEAAMISSFVPMLMIIADFIFFKNRPSMIRIITVIVSIFGIYLIISSGIRNTSNNPIGYLLMTGSCFVWIVYSVTTKSLFDRYNLITIIFYQLIFGAIFLFPLIFFEKINVENIDIYTIGNLLFLAILCSAVANFLYAYSMKHLSLSLCGIFINMIPVVSIAAGYLFLNEKITIVQLLGGIIVILSVSNDNLLSYKNK